MIPNEPDDRIEVADERDVPIFIHSELDDLGLNPYAFRIYARLARRAGTGGGAYEGIRRMAKGCAMSMRQARRSLRTLEDLGLIARRDRSREGKPSVYTLLPKSRWKVVEADEGADSESEGGGLTDRGGRTDRPGGAAYESAEGTPRKVLQDKELRTSKSPTGDDLATRPKPTKLENLEPFLDAWNEHRGDLPAARALNSSRRSKLRTLIRDLGRDEAYAALAIATSEVSNDPWWTKHGYGLDNLLAGQKVVQKAETAANRGTTDRREAEIDRLTKALA